MLLSPRRPWSLLQATLAVAGLLATLGLGACGRSAQLTQPAADVNRDGSLSFARGGNGGGLGKGKSAPAVPVLSSPADGALDVALPADLAWQASPGAQSYSVQVSTASDFSVLVADLSGIGTTSTSIAGLSASTAYFWRVSATNKWGTSAFSAPFGFTTAGAAPPPPPPPPPAGNPPAPPVLSSPADGAIDVSTAPTLSWLASTGATAYRLQVATTSDFAATVVDLSGIVATSAGISGLSNSTLYFWRVSASNADGSSAFSAPFSFTTVAAAPPPPPPPPGDPCGSLAGLGGVVINQFADIVQFRSNRLRVEVQGDVAAGTIDAIGGCSTNDAATVIWPSGTANMFLAGTNTSVTNHGQLVFGQLLFPGALLEPGVVVASDAFGNVLEIIWPEISGLPPGPPILRLQLADWSSGVVTGAHVDVVMTFVATAADGTSATFTVNAKNLLVPTQN